MPPRTRSPAAHIPGGYHPANDPGTFKDLLLFEERLKSNAARLKRRKRRYQCMWVRLTQRLSFIRQGAAHEVTLYIHLSPGIHRSIFHIKTHRLRMGTVLRLSSLSPSTGSLNSTPRIRLASGNYVLLLAG